MKDFKFSEHISRIAIAWAGTAAFISVLTDCALKGVSLSALLFYALVFNIAMIVIMFTKRIGIRFLLMVGGVATVISLLFLGEICTGAGNVINDCLAVVQRYYGHKVGNVTLTRSSSYVSDELIFLVFATFLLSVIMSAIVVYSKNMLLALLVELPVYILFISCAVIPEMFSFACYLMFVFGVASLEKGRTRSGPAYFILGSGLVLSIICSTVAPKGDYQRPEIFSQWNQFAMDHWGSLLSAGKNGKGAYARGGLNNGELGNIDKIRYSNRDMVTLNTINTGKNQYIGEFYGGNYSDNAWSASEVGRNITGQMVTALDMSERYQTHITDGNENYYELLKKYKTTVQFKGTEAVEIQDRICYDSDDYTKFDTFTQLKDFQDKGTNYSVKRAKDDYIAAERNYRNKVYRDYLTVPEEIQTVIHSRIGETTVRSPEEKEEYLQYVKDYLADNYTYSTSPGRVPDGTDFTIYFLRDHKEGYCTYFATAAVMMYRCAGIPARYVEGFIATASQVVEGEESEQTADRMISYDKSKQISYTNYEVTLKDSAAHAWVEVYMDGYGWVVQEVTPGVDQDVIDSDKGNQNVDKQSGSGAGSSGSDSAETDGSSNRGVQSNQSSDTSEEAGQNSLQNDSSENAEQQPEESEKGIAELVKEERQRELERQQRIDQRNTMIRYIIIAVLILMLVVIAIILLFFIIRKHHASNVRRKLLQNQADSKNEKVDRNQFIEIYEYLTKLLTFAGYRKDDFVDYERYFADLVDKNTIFADHHLDQVVDVILYYRFARPDGEEADSVKTQMKEREDLKMVQREVLGIREEILKKQNRRKRIIMRYVKRM